MKEIRTEIDIRAPVEKVWELLTDFKSFELWNPFIRKIEGTPSVGKKIKIHLHTSAGKSRSYQPKITMAETFKELRWFGKSTIPGLFNGERIFILEPIESNQTRFIHKEVYSIPKNLAERYDGHNLWFKVTKEEAETLYKIKD